ncbi:HAMP domain-containing protein [Paenibacillus sp. JMULE4]|nr:ATP-binding protein [Paenibacillus sp. JMULE4]NTZ17040.1 HAMP domain-containing protein [Paenibacillus sp. JMULE4]
MSNADKMKRSRKPILERFPFTWFPFTLLRGLILFILDLFRMSREHVERSIRLQLVLTFAICLGVSTLFYGISSALFGQINKGTVIDYSQGIRQIDSAARSLVRLLEPSLSDDEQIEMSSLPSRSNADVEMTDQESAQPVSDTDNEKQQQKKQQEERRKRKFMEDVQHLTTYENYKIVITDLEGKVIFRSENAPETYIDVHKVIRNAMETRNEVSHRRSEVSSFYPVTYDNQKSYLIVSGIPQPSISYIKGQSPLSLLSAIAVFIFLFYYLTRKKMRYIEELATGLRIIATGNLDHRVIERTRDELGSLAKDMNLMVADLQHTIEEERRAERLKNELVTNVSHDLRTPLTLIIGYLRLLHDKNYETPEQAAGYVAIAYSKAEKLQGLIEDLFEYTKLTHQDVPMHKREVAINEVLEQLLEEYVTLSEEQQLTLIRSIPQERLSVRIDVDKMIRVFENLLGNAIKYSPKPGTITVGMARERDHVLIRISNKADALTREELEQLFDRFYRVDKARTSDTGGSGLGLAIARSIVESHDGTIWAESSGGSIHFYVKLKLET